MKKAVSVFLCTSLLAGFAIAAKPATSVYAAGAATADQVQAFISDTDEKTVLVDARPQEFYAGWAMEGAKNGGHLKGAALFSARWLDCEYEGEAPREAYLEREMEEQGITKDSSVIVYDYTGEQAPKVAEYFEKAGVKDVSVFQANELIDAGTDVVKYENYDMFIPAEIVKSVSDVKTGKADTLTEEAKAVFGDSVDNVVIIDVGWGNNKLSSYLAAGHVPGAVHINSDSYERPRVYIPEKRPDYAKEWRKIPLEEFRDTVAPQYGITKDSTVILTGTTTSCYGRLGFYTRALGVKTYAMSGMLTAWKYLGYELDTDPSTIVIPESAESFGATEINSEEFDTEMVKEILSGKREGQIVDERGEDNWNGTYSGYSYHDLAGRLENSIWCPAHLGEKGEAFANVDNTPRTPEETLAYMESCGCDTSKDLVFFCGDSWGASFIAYWCNSIDLPQVKVWTQGWIPWSNEGNEFIDHNGVKVHYDKYLDTVLDENGNDVADGISYFIPEEKKEEG